MKRSLPLLIILFSGLSGCLDDPDPAPPVQDPIRSYFILYNFLTEPYEIDWELDGILVEEGHSYGDAVLGFTSLDTALQEISYTISSSDGSRLLKEGFLNMEENQYYLLAFMGTENEPMLLQEPMDLIPPPYGNVRLRLMHTIPGLDALDLYIGGQSEEFRADSGISYSTVTGYLECSRERIWNSLEVTPQDISPEDSTLFSFSQNNIFYSRRIYLGIIRYASSDSTSSLRLLFYDHPIFL